VEKVADVEERLGDLEDAHNEMDNKLDRIADQVPSAFLLCLTELAH